MTRKLLRTAAMLADNLHYACGAGKPGLLYKLARNHLRARLGRPMPRSICLAVDYRCNLRCAHCSARYMEEPHNPSLSLDQYRYLAEQIERLGFFNVQFTGGEPLLRPDLEEIIRLFHPRRTFLLVSTNATLLDEKRVRSLRAAGVDVLSVSLDDADAGVHDAFRGRAGAWRDTVRGVKLAVAGGLKVSLSAVVTHQNIRSPELDELARLIRSLGCGMQLNWACPVGAWAGNRTARLTEEDMQYLFKFLERHRHARTDFDGNYCGPGCPAAKEHMYVTAQGEVMPCAFIPVSYGNVTSEPLQTIRDRALSDPAYSHYWPRCLSACNDEFYDKYLRHTFGRRGPLPIAELEAIWARSDAADQPPGRATWALPLPVGASPSD